MKKVYLIHGWGGNSKGDWFVWLGKELEKKGIKVEAPEMPNTWNPTIKEWVGKLNKIVKADKDTILVGHSIGCQAVMRYLMQLKKEKIRGAILVAGWIDLTEGTWDEQYTKEIANQWLNTPLDFDKIRERAEKIIVINSDNDPFVEVTDADIFEKKLGAEKIILHNKGHISGEDGVTEFPLLLNKILELMK